MSLLLIFVACMLVMGGTILTGAAGSALQDGEEAHGRHLALTGEIIALCGAGAAFWAGRLSL